MRSFSYHNFLATTSSKIDGTFKLGPLFRMFPLHSGRTLVVKKIEKAGRPGSDIALGPS